MSAGKRVLLALVCTVLGVLTTLLLGTFRSLQYGWTGVGRSMEMLPVYLIIALAGWVVAVPFVLALRSSRGAQGRLTLVIGTFIGPALITVWLKGNINWVADGFTLLLSTVIALCTSTFYVVLLRRLTP